MGLFGEITSRAVSSGTTNPFTRSLDDNRSKEKAARQERAFINFKNIQENISDLPESSSREFSLLEDNDL